MGQKRWRVVDHLSRVPLETALPEQDDATTVENEFGTFFFKKIEISSKILT